MTNNDQLDADTVDIIFARFATVYGSRFVNQWPAATVPDVKAAWGRELREFAENLPAIDYALDHLPSGAPPMVLDFRDIARQHVGVTRATFERQKAPVTEEERERAVAILRSFRRPAAQDPKAWARRLKAREESGEQLTSFQRHCWRSALGVSEAEARST